MKAAVATTMYSSGSEPLQQLGTRRESYKAWEVVVLFLYLAHHLGDLMPLTYLLLVVSRRGRVAELQRTDEMRLWAKGLVAASAC